MTKEEFAATMRQVEREKEASIRLPVIPVVRMSVYADDLLERFSRFTPSPTGNRKSPLLTTHLRRNQFAQNLRATSTSSLAFDMGWDQDLGLGNAEQASVGRRSDAWRVSVGRNSPYLGRSSFG